MRKILLLAIALIAIIITVGASGCQYQGSTNQPAATNTNTPASGSQQPSSQAIAISNFSFVPNQITIAKGTTVTWTNNDSAQHQIAADDGSFNSAALSQGQSFQQTFSQEGAYSYHCAIHPSMKGTITVTK